MLQQRGYERFGLINNPFQDLASDTLEESSLFHVPEEADMTLQTIKEDVFEGRQRAVVAIIGPLGAGKTQRLRLALHEAKEAGIPAIYHQISLNATWAVQAVSKAIREQGVPSAVRRFVSPPKWYASLKKLEKRLKREYDPEVAGQALAGALNEIAPCFLLLNDLHNLEQGQEEERFMQTLHALENHLEPGVLVMMSCYPDDFERFERDYTHVTTRMDRRLHLRGLEAGEAGLLLAKRLVPHRLAKEMDPLYPFTQDALEGMLERAQRNPRNLLKVANRVLEHAIGTRAYHIEAGMVHEVESNQKEARRGASPQEKRATKGGKKNRRTRTATTEKNGKTSTGTSGHKNAKTKGMGKGRRSGSKVKVEMNKRRGRNKKLVSTVRR